MKLIDGTSVTLLERDKNRLNSRNTSGHTGVYFDNRRGLWVAQIGFKGKTYYLGSYSDKITAVTARETAEQMHEDFVEWYYAQRQNAITQACTQQDAESELKK